VKEENVNWKKSDCGEAGLRSSQEEKSMGPISQNQGVTCKISQTETDREGWA